MIENLTVLYLYLEGLPWWLSGKLSTCPIWKIPWKRKWQPTLGFLSGKSYGSRSLAAYCPWGCKESDTTQQLTNSNSLYMENYLNIMFFRNIYNKVQKCNFFKHLSCDKLSNTLNMFKALCHWKNRYCTLNRLKEILAVFNKESILCCVLITWKSREQ